MNTDKKKSKSNHDSRITTHGFIWPPMNADSRR